MNENKKIVTVGELREFIKDMSDDTQVFVCCEGYSNYDFQNERMYQDSDTNVSIYNGKLFIADSCAISDFNRNTDF